MTRLDPSGEPSMEDILASIRRIIAEDPPGSRASIDGPAAPKREGLSPRVEPAATGAGEFSAPPHARPDSAFAARPADLALPRMSPTGKREVEAIAGSRDDVGAASGNDIDLQLADVLGAARPASSSPGPVTGGPGHAGSHSADPSSLSVQAALDSLKASKMGHDRRDDAPVAPPVASAPPPPRTGFSFSRDGFQANAAEPALRSQPADPFEFTLGPSPFARAPSPAPAPAHTPAPAMPPAAEKPIAPLAIAPAVEPSQPFALPAQALTPPAPQGAGIDRPSDPFGAVVPSRDVLLVPDVMATNPVLSPAPQAAPQPVPLAFDVARAQPGTAAAHPPLAPSVTTEAGAPSAGLAMPPVVAPVAPPFVSAPSLGEIATPVVDAAPVFEPVPDVAELAQPLAATFTAARPDPAGHPGIQVSEPEQPAPFVGVSPVAIAEAPAEIAPLAAQADLEQMALQHAAPPSSGPEANAALEVSASPLDAMAELLVEPAAIPSLAPLADEAAVFQEALQEEPAQPAQSLSAPPVAQNSLVATGSQHETGVHATSRTMEDTVADLLRPMLRHWLAENMPRILERALRKELAESNRSEHKPAAE